VSPYRAAAERASAPAECNPRTTRAVYAIRHQRAGIITTRLYVERPSDDEVLRVARAHGDGWTRVVPLPIEVPDHALALGDHLDEFPEEPAAPVEPHGFPRVRFHGSGTIEPPRSR
jgi:hypothetical protein